MRCLLPNPCEVSFPASKQALTSNTCLFRGPALPPSWPCSSHSLDTWGEGAVRVPRRGLSGPLPRAFTVAGWAHDRMRTRVLSGLSWAQGCLNPAWLLIGQRWLIPESPGAGLWCPEEISSQTLSCRGYSLFALFLSLVIHVICFREHIIMTP